jgi:hypothetical protein
MKQSWKTDWSRWDKLLGTMPDEALSPKVGVSKSMIAARRKRLGIASYRDRQAFKRLSKRT